MTKASFSPCGSWEASKARVASPHFPQLSGEWTADLNECVCVEGAALKRRACLWIKARQKIPHVSKNKLSSMLSVTATPKRDGVYGQQRPDAAAASLSETGEHKRPSQKAGSIRVFFFFLCRSSAQSSVVQTEGRLRQSEEASLLEPFHPAATVRKAAGHFPQLKNEQVRDLADFYFAKVYQEISQ